MSIVILGAGAFAREAFDWCSQAGYTVSGFYANETDLTELRQLPVYSDPSLVPPDSKWVMGTGNPKIMKILADSIKRDPHPAVVHNSCVIGTNVSISPGSIVCPGTVITCDVEIGQGTIINIGCTIGHDCIVGDYCHLSPNTSLSGYTCVGDYCELGTGSSTIPRVSIAERSIVGAGAVLTKSVESGLHVGLPAITKKVFK